MRARHILIAIAAGLALADASIVTLALPELLNELDTTVQGVAAVLGVYTVVLAVALIPVERLGRRIGPGALGAGGLVLFAAASALCGASNDLTPLLAGRAVQAIGGAAALIAAFALLLPEGGGGLVGRRLWLGAAVLASACGPALGGALTEAFSWRAIFYVQAPIALVAALACVVEGRTVPARRQQVVVPQERVPDPPPRPPDTLWSEPAPGAVTSAETVVGGGARPAAAPATEELVGPTRFTLGPSIALALVSAALTAVLFLLVLLLVAGWDLEPLKAALAVTVIPAGALVGARIGGDATARAAAGCLLVGAGVLALAFLPGASPWWTVVPQAAAGVGMGLALPALGGELLPETTTDDAAKLLVLRHVGIALALAILAPVVASNLDSATERARERGIAVVLDAKLQPLEKLRLAPSLLAGVEAEQPRAGLRQALDEGRQNLEPDQQAAYDELAQGVDDTLVIAIGEAFRNAFLVTGALALLGAAALLMPSGRRRAAGAGREGPGAVPRRGVAAGVLAALAVAAVLPLAMAGTHATEAPEAVAIRDPCEERPLPDTGGLQGLAQDALLTLLDTTACKLGSSREELVLALADSGDRRRFEREHGVDPRDAAGVLRQLFG